jgi:hypothetical protein
MGDAYAHQSFGRTRAEWIANLDTEYTPKAVFRRTSIICTIGTYEKLSFAAFFTREMEGRQADRADGQYHTTFIEALAKHELPDI